MSQYPIGPYQLPHVRMPTWLIRFDKDGVCTSPATLAALLSAIKTGSYSNILLYSHGWNTDFADAVEQYSRFLTAFEAVVATNPLPNFNPIFVGVTWPSVWLPYSSGPQIAADANCSVDRAARSVHERMVAEIGETLESPRREEFYKLVDAPILSREEALTLAAFVSSIVSRTPAEVDGGEGEPIDAEGILKLAASLASAEPAVPVNDEDLDRIGAVGHGDGGLQMAGGGWDPADIIKLASLYQMKDRAGRVGSRGVAILLRKLLDPTHPPVHVFGHSFGAKVVLSALCAPEPLPRTPASCLLLQPAISHLCFAANLPGGHGPGGYKEALQRVSSPIFTTFSSMDFPLYNVFHLALRRPADLGELKVAAAGEPPDAYAALGGYGPRGSGEHIPLSPIPEPGQAYPDLTGVKLVGLDGSNQRITSHGDVANRYTAWALRTQIERT